MYTLHWKHRTMISYEKSFMAIWDWLKVFLANFPVTTKSRFLFFTLFFPDNILTYLLKIIIRPAQEFYNMVVYSSKLCMLILRKCVYKYYSTKLQQQKITVPRLCNQSYQFSVRFIKARTLPWSILLFKNEQLTQDLDFFFLCSFSSK